MAALAIKETLGADEATVAISFTNGEKLKYTEVVGTCESGNIVTFVKKDKQNLSINTDNINYISFIVRGGNDDDRNTAEY